MATNTSMLKKIAIVAACCMPFMAGSQNDAVGRTSAVQGLVTVSEGNIVRTARNGAAVQDASRIVTSSNGMVQIRLDNLCEFDLGPNQSVVIDYQKDCQTQRNMIISLERPSFAFMPVRDVANGLLYLIGAAWIFSGTQTGVPNPGGEGNLPDITPE